jgi:hypothetical protein
MTTGMLIAKTLAPMTSLASEGEECRRAKRAERSARPTPAVGMATNSTSSNGPLGAADLVAPEASADDDAPSLPLPPPPPRPRSGSGGGGGGEFGGEGARLVEIMRASAGMRR